MRVTNQPHPTRRAMPRGSGGRGWRSVAGCLGAAVGLALLGAETPAPSPAIPLPPAPPPGLPPVPTSPVDTLRQLLARGPAERDQWLANKPEAQRVYVRSRLAEFDSLKSAERQLQLRLLELYYYLLPLMRAEPASRAEQIRFVPATLRKLLQERLEAWDRLPPAQRRELLLNERVLRGFPRFESQPATDPQATSQATQLANVGLSPQAREKLEDDLQRWRGYTPPERQRMYQQFQQFFALSDQQREKALQTLATPTRRQTQQALAAFARLPAEQRAKCIAAFQRFAAMPNEERTRFLVNAARWESMAPEERHAWRELTKELPPAPPGLEALPPLPPLPPNPAPSLKPAVVTNAAK